MIDCSNIKAVLLDLDGTLLGLDMDEFIRTYVTALAGSLSHMVDPRLLAKELMRASDGMIESTDPSLTNEEVFNSRFYPALNKQETVLRPEIMKFYNEIFPTLGTMAHPVPGADLVVSRLKQKGYSLILATNPVFPRIAIEHRIRWAGLDPGIFDVITSFEHMHSCKPSENYFREISLMIGIPPESCIMVGNDVDDDLPSGKIGMKTFLVDTWRLNKSSMEPECDFQGSLSDLLALLG